MQLKPPQLADHLSQHLAPCYLISGDEPLIVQECADAIRAAARAAGCTERQRITISSKDDWLELGHSAGSLSLFADRKLIELQLPSGKPGTEGSKAIQEYLAGDQEDVLLIVSGRIDKQSQKSKWYVALDQAGVILAGLTADNDAVTLLAERLEGNLLAASQEIEKLRLLHGEQTITAELVADTVSDNARYDAFRLVDVALSGDSRGAVRTLRGLRAESIQPPVLLWALSREVRLLADLKREIARGTPVNAALSQRGVWRNRQGLVRSAMNRLGGRDLAEMQALSFHADGASKGFMQGEPWSLLERLVVVMAQGSLPTSTRERRA
jgi:DNA polymerase-3 subunit delta